jgi:predicted O-linked N-acetylglucosamine transferase (SPINDLY family)
MPDVYQVSDRKRVAGPKPTRQSCGLPETGFVFCSFNNNYKLTPEMFDVWMSILRRVPGSVLWLLADNQWAEGNLRLEAEARGIDASRLVFAGRVSPENYLARYLIADLFLDSFPFNAGTTANDALFMGLPVLTCSGRSFASKMAGALLTAAGCPELITTNIATYQEEAVQIALDKAALIKVKKKLVSVGKDSRLFDTPRFVSQLEHALYFIQTGDGTQRSV